MNDAFYFDDTRLLFIIPKLPSATKTMMVMEEFIERLTSMLPLPYDRTVCKKRAPPWHCLGYERILFNFSTFRNIIRFLY